MHGGFIHVAIVVVFHDLVGPLFIVGDENGPQYLFSVHYVTRLWQFSSLSMVFSLLISQ